jgi:uncharacterized protein (DUF1697 family)
MENLRLLFEELGFAGVETFLASGNVIFETSPENLAGLVRRIETKLEESLGYPVPVFLRNDIELAEIVRYRPFDQAQTNPGLYLNVAFLSEPLEREAQHKLYNLRTEIDDFDIHGREIYWKCLKKQSESTFSNAVLEKTIGRPSTLRGIKTIQQMVEKYISSLDSS